MGNWIQKALTRRIRQGGHKPNLVVDPDDRLVYAIEFAIGMTVCLVALEVSHMIFLRSWNSEIFVAISSLVTFVSGVFVGQKV